MDDNELVLDKVCPFCSDNIKAYPRKVVSEAGWSDFNGKRTNRVTIEFEAVHQCGKRAPVERLDHSSPILDTLKELSTPPEGVRVEETYRPMCSDMVKELSRED